MGSDGLYTFCGFSAGVYPSCGGKFCIGWNPAEIFEIKAVGGGGGGGGGGPGPGGLQRMASRITITLNAALLSFWK